MARPISKKGFGSVSVAIWGNEKNGKPYDTFTFSQNYKDANGEWKESKSFTVKSLAELSVLVNSLLSDNIRTVGAPQPQLNPQQPRNVTPDAEVGDFDDLPF